MVSSGYENKCLITTTELAYSMVDQTTIIIVLYRGSTLQGSFKCYLESVCQCCYSQCL